MTYAEISEQGKEFMAQVFPEHEKKLHELTNVLSNEEKEQAIELMKKLGLSIKDLSY